MNRSARLWQNLILHPYWTCPVQTCVHAGTNPGRAAGRDLLLTARAADTRDASGVLNLQSLKGAGGASGCQLSGDAEPSSRNPKLSTRNRAARNPSPSNQHPNPTPQQAVRFVGGLADDFLKYEEGGFCIDNLLVRTGGGAGGGSGR